MSSSSSSNTNKRPAASGIAGLISKKSREDERHVPSAGGTSGASAAAGHGGNATANPYLTRPDNPEKLLTLFLMQARNEARRANPQGTKFPVTEPYCEIEARIGILRSPFGRHDMRVASSGPKRVSLPGGRSVVANAFLVSAGDEPSQQQLARPAFEGGITRSHYVHWTAAGLSEPSPISAAFGIRSGSSGSGGSESAAIKKELVEVDTIETVYGGYANDNRVAFPGEHHVGDVLTDPKRFGRMECKSKITGMDVALPAAPYDLRLQLATERTVDDAVRDPPNGWSTKRVKRRRSYSRRDKSFAWRLDVTEVTTTASSSGIVLPTSGGGGGVAYEIELELNAVTTLKLINEGDQNEAQKLCRQLAQQAWWMMGQINPAHDVLDVEEFLREHPDREATRLALAQCGALKRFVVDGGGKGWRSAVVDPAGGAAAPTPPASLYNIKFMGCMPVNFQRHNLDEIQRSEDNGYFCSEKTDGVRYLMVFTGKTVVLVDRSMKGKQPIPRPGGSGDGDDPMAPVIPLIKAGTVLDGEVVMHRKLGRPVFIVFDVLAVSTESPVLTLPFEKRLEHLRKASFRTPNCPRDMFAKEAIADKSIALPLVRKNFVKRTDLDNLLSHVVEERGVRVYRSGDVHNHLTDGIIFQPNLPYVCGTDVNLLKWKYLDTVTIDVEILPNDPYARGRSSNDDEDVLRVGVVAEEGVMVDMTRFIKLPPSERRRLEADRAENNSKIAEVGFDPTTGEWYYLTMRPDKVASNHISTVIGTLLELAESLSTEELRYRMSVPPSQRDTYRKESRGMLNQLLGFQRQRNQQAAAASQPSRHHQSNGR